MLAGCSYEEWMASEVLTEEQLKQSSQETLERLQAERQSQGVEDDGTCHAKLNYYVNLLLIYSCRRTRCRK